jgi:hypothetical protein
MLWRSGFVWLHTTLEGPWPQVSWDGLWTLFLLGSHNFHGHGSWLSGLRKTLHLWDRAGRPEASALFWGAFSDEGRLCISPALVVEAILWGFYQEGNAAAAICKRDPNTLFRRVVFRASPKTGVVQFCNLEPRHFAGNICLREVVLVKLVARRKCQGPLDFYGLQGWVDEVFRLCASGARGWRWRDRCWSFYFG